MKITSVLLAGGQNRRMNGIAKWELQMGQETMLARSIGKLKKVSAKIIIVSNEAFRFPRMKNEEIPIQIVNDKTPYLGPLNGIGTALNHSQGGYQFVVAADMPFFSTQLAEYMLELALNKGADVVIPKWKGKFQPLHGIYHATNILPSITKDLEEEKYSLIKWLLQQKNIYVVEESEVREFNRNGRIFFNMNNPAEHQQALNWIMEED